MDNKYYVIFTGRYASIEYEGHSLTEAYRIYKQYQIDGLPVILMHGEHFIYGY